MTAASVATGARARTKRKRVMMPRIAPSVRITQINRRWLVWALIGSVKPSVQIFGS